MVSGQHQGSFLLKLIDFKMGHYAKNMLEMYLTLVVGKIVWPNLFELREMYMLGTSLQSDL